MSPSGDIKQGSIMTYGFSKFTQSALWRERTRTGHLVEGIIEVQKGEGSDYVGHGGDGENTEYILES